ncbi:hypothetical protein HHI36_001962 [Cryptolaemus montrouzieri]|uniref:Cuticle protein n=1 Tax=Cryptolaemus montrouzieri TaxID=559131 RepID=A0ABD2P9S0_9CUCU
MNCVAIAVFFAVLAATNAGLVAPLAYSAIPTGNIIQGPSSRSTVIGPDGSSISSVAPGGTIISENGATLVAQGAPAAVITPSARIASIAAPLVAAPHAIAYGAAPVLAPQGIAYGAAPLLGNIAAENTLVAGPSGTISQTRGIHGAHLAYL